MHARLSRRSGESTRTCDGTRKLSKVKAPKSRAKRRTADIEVVAEQTSFERAEHTTLILKLEGDL